MSSLPTRGRVIIDTTAGELDIELWSRECPKACRNFLALAMEGYYDGILFHRIVPNFLIQTGDRTGTGEGGESFYGEQFEDEIHPRLRFSHRGILACANNGSKNSNDSQFFITLDRADELHGKHTLFGRCVGDTIYNVVKIGAMEIDTNQRPVYPPKIKNIRIIDNPFDDIIPRITAAEKRAQQRAKQQAQKEREEAERKRKGAKKDVKLLSFAGGEGVEELDTHEVVFKKKSIVRPDLLEGENQSTSIPDFVSKPRVDQIVDPRPDDTTKPSTRHENNDIKNIREKHAQEQASKQTSRQLEISKMEAEIRKLSKRAAGGALDDDSDEDDSSRKKAKKTSYLEQELSKYSKGRVRSGGVVSRDVEGRKRNRDESDILAALNNFRGMLKTGSLATPTEPTESVEPEGAEPEEGIEIDTDQAFLSHSLHFPKDNTEEVNKAERDYEVIDPRARNARAKEEERARRNAEKGRTHRSRR